MNNKPLVAEIEYDGHDLFVIVEGVKIAKRGLPGTSQAGQWVSLEPGYVVHDDPDDPNHLMVELKGVTQRLDS